jgi:hypothetical protein
MATSVLSIRDAHLAGWIAVEIHAGRHPPKFEPVPLNFQT